MEQSALSQAVVRLLQEQGRRVGHVEEARRILMLQGEAKFGPKDPAYELLKSIDDLARLEELAVRLVTAATWQELLPALTHRRGRKTRG
jgi:hypothetical protein